MFLRPRVLCVLIVGLLGDTTMPTAQSSGTFAPTSSMTTARSLHSATLLPNGQVLLTGGTASSNGAPLASAELYDPGTGTFRSTGTMITARRLHSATLLPDGRVLIAGGDREGGVALASAETFDPATGTFSATGSLLAARSGHTAILLATGNVLIVGGYGTRAYPELAPAEIYDPLSGTFSAAGAYVGRGGCDFCAPAVLLPDGTVLFPGQHPAQVYDPVSKTFSPGGMMSSEQSTAATLMNGQVLFAGGEDLGRLASAELYDPATHTFSRAGSMTFRRVWHSLTLLPTGAALAAGGETDSCSGNACFFAGSVASAELYDPPTNTFLPTGSMSAARETHTATLLGDGRVLVAGGVSYGGIGIFGGTLSSAELYTPDVLVPAPALVSLSGDGRGQGAIFHGGTTHVADARDPAAAGESVDIYCVGLTADSAIPPQIAIGGRMARLLRTGQVPGRPGVMQVTVSVPGGIAPETAVSVRLTYIGRPSNEVTLAVQ